MKRFGLGVILFFLFSCGGFADSPQYQPRTPCATAKAPENYAPQLNISPELKDKIHRYREDWASLCQGKLQPRGLSWVYSEAKSLEGEFSSLTDSAYHEPQPNNEENVNKESGKAMNILNNLAGFIPGFVAWEYEGPSFYFTSSEKLFQKALSYGNREDRLFFDNYARIGGGSHSFLPWVIMRTDYNGCDNSGKVDWIQYFRTIALLKKNLKSEVYRGQVSSVEERLIPVFAESGTICTCGDKSAVLKDFANVYGYARKEPYYRKIAPKIKLKLEMIRRNKIRIYEAGKCRY